MRKTTDENNQLEDVELLFEIKAEAEEAPVLKTVPVIVEAKAQSNSVDIDLYSQEIITLVNRIAELEDKFVKFELDLSALVKKRGKKMKIGKKTKHKNKGKDKK